MFTTAAVIYVLAPLLWYGAIEFGYIQPIRTPEFKHATNVASLALLMVILYHSTEVWFGGRASRKQKQSQAPSTTE